MKTKMIYLVVFNLLTCDNVITYYNMYAHIIYM